MLALEGCGGRAARPGGAQASGFTGATRKVPMSTAVGPESNGVPVVGPVTPTNAPPPAYPLLVPQESPLGRVMSVNSRARFIVIDFSFQAVPAAGARLGVYDASGRVGTVRVTGTSRQGLMAADVMEGTVGVGDEVRPDS